jgi:hypothetical protein
VLKDFVGGKLVFNCLRPDYIFETHGIVDTRAPHTGAIEPLEPSEPMPKPVPHSYKEAAFDKEYFTEPKSKKTKLTKAEKREIKFAAKKGVDIEQVDLSQVSTKKGFKGYGEKKEKNRNKFAHFAEMDLDS